MWQISQGNIFHGLLHLNTQNTFSVMARSELSQQYKTDQI